MENIYSEADLNSAIQLLESKQAVEEIKLKEQFHLTYESLKPLNIIKNIFKQAKESENLKNNILINSVGLTVGYLSKILFEKISNSPLKRHYGDIVMSNIKKLVSNNPDEVKTLIKKILQIIGSKRHK